MAPKKKASKKAPSVGLRGKKKGVPPAAGLRPKKQKPLVLKVGKTYETQDGSIHVKITDIDPTQGKTYAATGAVTKGNRLMKSFGTFWRVDGLYHAPDYEAREGWLDLVREVVKRRGK